MYAVSLTTNTTIPQDRSTYRNIYMIKSPRNSETLEWILHTHCNANVQVKTMHIKMTWRLAFRNTFRLTKCYSHYNTHIETWNFKKLYIFIIGIESIQLSTHMLKIYEREGKLSLVMDFDTVYSLQVVHTRVSYVFLF